MFVLYQGKWGVKNHVEGGIHISHHLSIYLIIFEVEKSTCFCHWEENRKVGGSGASGTTLYSPLTTLNPIQFQIQPTSCRGKTCFLHLCLALCTYVVFCLSTSAAAAAVHVSSFLWWRCRQAWRLLKAWPAQPRQCKLQLRLGSTSHLTILLCKAAARSCWLLPPLKLLQPRSSSCVIHDQFKPWRPTLAMFLPSYWESPFSSSFCLRNLRNLQVSMLFSLCPKTN